MRYQWILALAVMLGFVLCLDSERSLGVSAETSPEVNESTVTPNLVRVIKRQPPESLIGASGGRRPAVASDSAGASSSRTKHDLFASLQTTAAESNFADDEDDDEPIQVPGVLARYTVDGHSVTRRETDIAFVWGRAAADQRLNSGPFQAEWAGKLLVKAPGKYRFHAQVQGKVTFRVGDELVLQADSEQPQWISGLEKSFEYGEHPLRVEFHSVSAGARLKLYWSSDSFLLEPIPAAALFLNEAHPELETESRGRQLFAAHRCNRCHQQEHDPSSPPGPDLTHVTAGLQPGWLHSWLTAPSQSGPHATMPEFGLNEKEARAVEAFLRQQSQPATLSQVQPKPGQLDDLTRAGQVLFHSLGCLACHEQGDWNKDDQSQDVAPTAAPLAAKTSPLGGGDLSRIGEKRTLAWLQSWLSEPAKLNADHRMPVFALKRDSKTDEVLQLATYLSQRKKNPVHSQPANSTPDVSSELVSQGRKLVQEARCAACHRIPGITANLEGISRLDKPLASLETNGCLQSKPDRKRWRPAYPQADRPAIQAYLATRLKQLSPENSQERGARLLTWNNCLRCHSRDGGTGLGPITALAMAAIPELNGQGPTLVPPSLNAVGDKLRDESLLKAVAGDTGTIRLPWLRIRMPRFHHSEEDRASLSQYFIQHDRIETPPPDVASQPTALDETQRFQVLAVGHTLLGSQGFSCIACHRFGTFEPRNTALGTRGSDLRLIGQRMRREFFLRWTRSPIRVVPNMEMPSFERPVEGLLGGRIDAQLDALWESLQDPNTSRPLEISAVQQNLVVKSGEPARIVRDVFSIVLPNNEVHIPRSFAVGFSNQHNILIDLDTFRLREWWLGDFARQRTEGKSWYWDLGGVRVATTLGLGPDLALLRGIESDLTLITPTSNHGVVGTLREYSPVGQGVRLKYQLQFLGATPDQPLVLSVVETLRPLESDDTTGGNGWSREFEITGIPEGFRAVLIRPDVAGNRGRFDVSPRENSATQWRPMTVKIGDPAQVAAVDVSFLNPGSEPGASGAFHYVAIPTPVFREAPRPVVQIAKQEAIHTVPGYDAIRLPLPRSIMPTALTWTRSGTLAIASLKGHVYLARDTNGDGIEDDLRLFEEGLAAPYGLIADESDDGLIVSHKPEVLRLSDTNGDGRADLRQVLATGWGYNDNYHDWTCGIVRDSQGRLYVGLGSDYTQSKRPREQQRWRGKILRIDRSGNIEPIASGLRYPTGLAMTSEDDLFVTDNQGEQNVFNELNHIVQGERYGVPSMEDKAKPATGPTRRPAIQIPHPWTRSINGIFFLPRDARLAKGEQHPFAGHGIGCEYDTRFLIRFSLQKVGETFQGAVYPFSTDQVPAETLNFEGTLSGGVSPRGDLLIGCIHDSGWLGGLNVGSLYRLRQTGAIPLGIREIQASPDGFIIDLTGTGNADAISDPKNFTIAAYTREWQGSYATPDSQRHQVGVKSVKLTEGGKRIFLTTDKLRAGFVYEITCGKIGIDPSVSLWPATGHYTMNRVPKNPH